jgi:c-di-AMP phosphodiesterase-like protein
MKKLICLLLLLVPFFLFICNAQKLDTNRGKTINSFIKDILNDKVKNDLIIHKYVKFNGDNSVAFSQRNDLMNHMIDSLRRNYGKLLAKSGKKIVSYENYKGDKQNFGSEENQIEILTQNNVPMLYFYFIDENIASFFYLRKGSIGYFILP